MKNKETYPIIAPARGLAIAICFMAAGGLPAVAHDFFLLPANFHPAVGDAVDVRMHVSDTFPGEPGPWRTKRVAGLFSVDPGGRFDLISQQPPDAENESPTALRLTPRVPGPCVVALAGHPSYIDLKHQDFADYVAHEGHRDVVEALRRMKVRGDTVREKYSRFVKTVVAAGEDAEGDAGKDDDERDDREDRVPSNMAVTRPVGLRMEIVPLADPSGLKVGEELPVEVLFEGRPVTGALVSAVWAGFSKEHDKYAFSARTDERGRVSVPIGQAGPWLVRVSKMVPLTGKDSDAQWESFWASLTFEVPPAARD